MLTALMMATPILVALSGDTQAWAKATDTSKVTATPTNKNLPQTGVKPVVKMSKVQSAKAAQLALLAKASKLKDTKPFPSGAWNNANSRRGEWLKSNRTVKPGTPRATAVLMLSKYNWDIGQWKCLDRMWWHESGWSYHSGGASYGIPQALPGSKMAKFGKDWRTNPTTQIKWGLAYIHGVYGSPCQAFHAWTKRAVHGSGWY
jgi:hypothetical protein